MHLNNRVMLKQWYYDNYSSQKGFSDSTATRIASRYADIVCASSECEVSDGARGNVRGVLGEVLAVAALDCVSMKCYHHRLSTNKEDHEGIDVNVFNGVPNPLIGIGVKLYKGGIASTYGQRPVVNIRIKEDTFFIDELIETQANGQIFKPSKYVEGIFCLSTNKDAFLEVLNRQFAAALENGVIQQNTMAATYSAQFL